MWNTLGSMMTGCWSGISCPSNGVPGHAPDMLSSEAVEYMALNQGYQSYTMFLIQFLIYS